MIKYVFLITEKKIILKKYTSIKITLNIFYQNFMYYPTKLATIIENHFKIL